MSSNWVWKTSAEEISTTVPVAVLLVWLAVAWATATSTCIIANISEGIESFNVFELLN